MTTLLITPRSGALRTGRAVMRRPDRLGLGALVWLMLLTLCPAAALAEQAPAGTILPGTRYATPYYVVHGAEPGPLVVITGGVHGDETAGAAAAEAIRVWPITRGTLVVIPRANVPALAAHKRNIPGETAALGNLNRNFPRAARKEPPRGELATAIWERLTEWKPAWTIDLHEGGGYRAQNEGSVGSSIISSSTTLCRGAAEMMLAAVNATIGEPEKKFVHLRTPVDGSLARAARTHLGANAMIVETTIKGQLRDKRVGQHLLMVRTLLRQIGMMTEGDEQAALALGAKSVKSASGAVKGAKSVKGVRRVESAKGPRAAESSSPAGSR